MTMNPTETVRLQNYLRMKFGTDRIRIKPRKENGSEEVGGALVRCAL